VLPQSLPPQVAIVQPTPDFTTAQREVEVQIMLTDQGGGIGKVVWAIDGVTLGVSRVSRQYAGRGQTIPGTQRFVLTPGTNTITVVAYDQQELVASTPATLVVHLATPPPAPPALPPATPPSHPLPPLVTFVSPATDTTVTQPNLAMQVSLTDQGGGIGKVLWTFNEVSTTDTSAGNSVERQGRERTVHTTTAIPSEPGKWMLTKSFVLKP